MSDPSQQPDNGNAPGDARPDPVGAGGDHTGIPDGDGLPGATQPSGVVAFWKRTYGASPLHLLLHLAAIALIAWALSQSFNAKYSAAYVNLAIWMVGGAILNDFVALPIYVGLDKTARYVWGTARGTRIQTAHAPVAVHPDAPATATDFDASWGTPAAHDHALDVPRAVRHVARVPGNGHVRYPLVMSAVLLLVYFPNIMHKAPIGHRLSTGLTHQPDWAGRWLAITAALLLASTLIYAIRLLLARRTDGNADARPSPDADIAATP